MRNFLWILALFLLIAGCEKPIPNPESIDPIYSDLNSQLSAANSELVDAKSDLASAHEDLKKAKPQTGERNRALKAIETAEHRITKIQQNIDFLEIRKEKRLEFDRKAYLKAFREKKPWPDKEEWAEYQVNRRLVTAERVWIPKVKNPIPFLGPKPANSGSQEKKGEKSEGEKSEE